MDIALREKDGVYDIAVMDGEILIEDTLETSIVLSLLSDRRVRQDELSREFTDQRGFWGDLLGDSPPIGSKLWLLNREKLAYGPRFKAENYAKEALEHLVEDDFLDGCEVSASYKDDALLLEVDNFLISTDSEV